MTSYFFAVSALNELSALEVHCMYKLRVDVFVHEQASPCAEIDAVDPLGSTLHIRAFDSGRELAGVARLFPDTREAIAAELPAPASIDAEELWHFGRLCTATAHRGTGLGARLLLEALAIADSRHPEWPVFITAQTPLIDYYAAHGFAPCGIEFDWDGIAHVPMLRPAAAA